MLVAGVDYDSFGVYLALVDAGNFSLSDLVIIRFRDATREKDASYAYPAALRVPGAVRAALTPPALERRRRRFPAIAYVERAWTPRGQLRQVFALGRVQGLIVAALLELDVPVEELTPAEWRKELGVPGNCKKAEAHLALAELYPTLKVDPRLIDENVRDALAIAYAGAKRNARDTA